MTESLNGEDVSRFFTTDGRDCWQMVGYCGEPTATFENLKTGERKHGAVHSPLLRPFKRLVQEQQDD